MSRARDLADSADKDIAGTLTLDGLTVDGSSSIRHTDATTNISLTPTSTGGVLNVRDSSGNSQISLDARTTQVGIGTSSPTRQLSLYGTLPAIAFQTSTSGTAGGDGFQIQANSTDVYLWNYENTPVRFGTNGSERMQIDSSGNVGIGTTSTSTNYGAYQTPLIVERSSGYGYVEIRSGSTANQAGLLFNRQGSTGWLNAMNNTGNLRIAPMASINETGLTNAKDGSTGITIHTAGKIGINNALPSYMLDTVAVSGIVPARIAAASGDAQIYLQYNTSTTGQFIGCNSSGKFQVQRGSDGTTMMAVDTSGFVTSKTAHQVGVQSTSLYNTGTGVGILSDDAYGGCGSHIEVGTRASKGWASIYLQRRWQSGEDDRFISFNVDPYSGSGSVVGTITHTGSSTSYNTSSDYRLKENVTDVTDGITRVKQLAPKRFNFIVDPDKTVDGFIAHEAQAVVPEAVTGTQDAMRDEEYEVTPAVLDDDGNVVTDAVMGTRSVPDYQGIDQSKLVPLLTAALQEAIAKIETLETKVAALEGA